jgi:hypothetical protein
MLAYADRLRYKMIIVHMATNVLTKLFLLYIYKCFTLKTQEMPLAILEGGAVLFLDEEYIVQCVDNNKGGLQRRTSIASESSESPSRAGTPESSSQPAISESQVLRKKLSKIAMLQGMKSSYVKQQLILQFDVTTTYLCVPFKKIKNILQNESHATNLGTFCLFLFDLKGYFEYDITIACDKLL